MNYFELHVGDYEAATAHLSLLEDACYGRMIRLYYRMEKPLPVDVKQVCRLVRAVSKVERDAVQVVLDEFFELREDGWHQARCDAELARYAAAEPEREAKKANEETRLRRHREERSTLFQALNEAGRHAPWNTKIEVLRAMVVDLPQRTCNTPATAPATPPATPPATAPATPATATHGNVSPTPTTHYPIPKEREEGGVCSTAPPRAHVHEPTRAGQAVLRMKAQGLTAGINPSHPRLLALLEAGVTDDELADAAREAVDKRKPFAYALAIVEGRRRDAAQSPPLPPTSAHPTRQTATERRVATLDALTGRSRRHERTAEPAAVVDVSARVVP